MSTGQQLGVDMANTFMLTLLFSLIADMSENPDGFRADARTALCELADDHKLPGVAPEIAREARAAAKLVIAGVLQSSKPIDRQ
jgi:hypothetical protein